MPIALKKKKSFHRENISSLQDAKKEEIIL